MNLEPTREDLDYYIKCYIEIFSSCLARPCIYVDVARLRLQVLTQNVTRMTHRRRDIKDASRFIIHLHREILDGRIFLTVEGPRNNILLKKRHKNMYRREKQRGTVQIYGPLAPRNSGGAHFPYCRRASRQ